MKKLTYLFIFCFQVNSFAQDTQTQIDSIMTLYPNCAEYPMDVLVQLDSLLVALGSEGDVEDLVQESDDQVDTIFFNYLSENYSNLIQNGQIDSAVASTITELNLDGLGLYNINGVELFSNLELLSCENNNLLSFPLLPNQISTLFAKWNNLNEILHLPPEIVTIDLRHNSINTIAYLPESVEDLKLCFNELTSLPNLPNNLEVLFCAYNDLTSLPALPNNVEQVLCYGNQISGVDFLPESIATLSIQNNNLTYLPHIPDALLNLDINNNPIACVNTYPEQLEEMLGNYPSCFFGCTEQESINFSIEANLDDGSCEHQPSINWPQNQEEINTGTNATYLIEELQQGDSIILEGFSIGAFYVNSNGGLNCAGFSTWGGGVGSIAVYADDLTTEEKDGFSQGEQIVWLVSELGLTDSIENNYYIAEANYISGSDAYSQNSINLVSNFVFYPEDLAIIGCTNNLAHNYELSSTIDDSSCVFQHETDLAELIDSITNIQEAFALLQIELASQQSFEATNSYLLGALEAWNISLILTEGWNMIGYCCPNPIDISQALSSCQESIVIVKDNYGDAYLPEFDFNGIGDLIPGQGYQVKAYQEVLNINLCDWFISEVFEHSEDGPSIETGIYGCTNTSACNYLSTALLDNGSCEFPEPGLDCEGN